MFLAVLLVKIHDAPHDLLVAFAVLAEAVEIPREGFGDVDARIILKVLARHYGDSRGLTYMFGEGVIPLYSSVLETM